MRTKWLQTPWPRIAPSGWRRGDGPPWDSAEEDGLGLGSGRAGAGKVFEGMRQRPGGGRGDVTLAADGVVPEGTGAVVLGALEVAPAGGGGVLELLVTVVAIVLAQRHLLRLPLLLSSPSGAPSGFRRVRSQEFRKSFLRVFIGLIF